MVKRRQPVGALCIQLCQRVICGRDPRSIPCGFVEGCVCLFIVSLKTQCKPKIVVRLSAIGIRVQACETFYGFAEMLFCPSKFAALQPPLAKSVVAETVTRITPQRFLPIDFWSARCMAILPEMQPRKIQFLVCRNLRGQGRFFRRLWFRRRLYIRLTETGKFPPAFFYRNSKLFRFGTFRQIAGS